jgi:hypothetical protein
MLEVKDKAAALKFTRIAQVLFVVAGGAAVAVAFVGGPKGTSSTPSDYKASDVAVNLPGEKAAVNLDLAGASARMGLIGNAPRPVPPPEPVTPSDEGVAPTPPTATEAHGGGVDVIQYLGPVRLGSKTLALLSIHGKQRFAGLNDSTEDGVVTEITSDHVTLTLREVERKINRASRSGEVLTRVSGVPGGGKSPFARPMTAAPRGVTPATPAPVQPMATARPTPVSDPTAHYEDIRARLKGTGMYQNEEDLSVAAKQELERQMMSGKPPEKGSK